jgi:hypothetical protein
LFYDTIRSEYAIGLNTVGEALNTARFPGRFFIVPMALESLILGKYARTDPLQHAIKLSHTLSNLVYGVCEFPAWIVRVSGTKV